MKVDLHFDLDQKPDQDNDEFDLQCALKGKAMWMALIAIREYLREQDKYVEPEKQDSIEKVRERFIDFLNEEDVNLDSFG